MGQLEKYGLYVLCLVIFLILGVAIWGGDPAPLPQTPAQELSKSAAANAVPGSGGKEANKPAPSSSDVLEQFFNKRASDAKDKDKLAQAGAPAGTTGGTPGGAQPGAPAGAQIGAQPGSGSAGPLAPNASRPAGNDRAASGGPEARNGNTPVAGPPAPRVHKIKKGEYLEDIAFAELGSKHRWKEILALNPGLDPNRMPENREIKLPSRELKLASKSETSPNKGAPERKAGAGAGAGGAMEGKKAAAAPSPGPSLGKGTYTTRRGDTLTSISLEVYGNSKHVSAIFAANRNQLSSPDKVPERIVLNMPARS